MMKKLIALALALTLLCGCTAVLAEGGEQAVLETEGMQGLIGGTLLTEASISQASISPYYESDLFCSDKKDPWYVTFPIGEGRRVTAFGVKTLATINPENGTQYLYNATDRYSYEDFLLDCKEEDLLVLDGSEGVAAYASPDNSSAYALFGLDEIQAGAKLYLRIFAFSELRQMEDAEKTARLKELVEAEAARMREGMACVQSEKFWTDGAFQGVKLYCKSVPGEYLNVDMAELACNFTEEGFSGRMFPGEVDGSKMTCYVVKDRSSALKIEFNVDTYSYVDSKDESEITRVTLSDGNEWKIYVSNKKDSGELYAVHAAKVLNPGEENPVFLTLRLSSLRNDLLWADMDAFVKDLDAIAAGIR